MCTHATLQCYCEKLLMSLSTKNCTSVITVSNIVFYRQFEFRMDKSLPFYVWTLNERFTEEELPSFDEVPHNVNEDYVPRLHRLNRRSREDNTIICGGRALLPVRHAPSLRQRLYRRPTNLPDIPEELERNIREFRDRPFVVTNN